MSQSFASIVWFQYDNRLYWRQSKHIFSYELESIASIHFKTRNWGQDMFHFLYRSISFYGKVLNFTQKKALRRKSIVKPFGQFKTQRD